MDTKKKMNINEYESEYKEYKKMNKFCQCFIEDGKRKGQRCYKYNCFSHKKQTLEIIQKEKESMKLIGIRFPCRARIKKEKGHGYDTCGRVNCKFHSIICDILELPDAFFECEKYYNQSINKPFSTKDLIEFYELSFENIEHNDYKSKYGSFLKKLLSFFQDNIIEQKWFLIAYIGHVLDTRCARKTIMANKQFQKIFSGKIEQCINATINETNVEYISYFQSSFTADINKKYILKSRNKKYNILLFKLIIKIFLLYRKTLAITYMPGGKLFLEAQERFYKNAVEY